MLSNASDTILDITERSWEGEASLSETARLVRRADNFGRRIFDALSC